MAPYPKKQVQIHTIHTKNEIKAITIIIICPIALQKVTIAPVFTFNTIYLHKNCCGSTGGYIIVVKRAHIYC